MRAQGFEREHEFRPHRHRGLLAWLMLVLLAGLVVGCGRSSGDPLAPVPGDGGGGAATLTAANSLYVIQPGDTAFLPATPAYLLQYPKSATGSPNPTTEITGQSQILFDGVTMDPAGKLYVSAVTAGKDNETEILEYQVGATGMAAPVANYPTPEPGLSAFGAGLDGSLYLTAGNTIWQMQGGAVVRTIQSPTQDLTSPDSFDDAKGIAADAAGTVYVLNGDVLDKGQTPVLIYNAGTNGKALPNAELKGDQTGFTQATAIALDRAGNLYLGTSTAVLVFAAGASGNVPPTRVITGAATTINGVSDLKVDSTGVVYVLTGNVVDGSRVVSFAAGATGNIAPVTMLGVSAGKAGVKVGFAGIAVM